MHTGPVGSKIVHDGQKIDFWILKNTKTFWQLKVTRDIFLGQQRLSVCPPWGYTFNSSVLLTW